MRRLTLQEAIRMAAERNLDVRAELYNTALFEADIHRFRGIYDLLLSALLDYRDSTTLATNNVITGGSPTIEQKSVSYNAGATQLLPTGGTVGLTFNNNWTKANFGSIRDFYESDLTLNVAQPLLQNFGQEVTELNISISRLNKEGSFEQFQTRLLNTVNQVTAQYFQLVSSRQDVDIRKASLALSERILSDTQARVKAGVLPAMEIINAEFGVASRQRELLDAERAVKDQNDALRLLLQLPPDMEIVPVDAFRTDPYPTDEAAEMKRAMAVRPELKQLDAALKTSELQNRVARKQTLPNLLVTASVAPTGLGSTYSRDLERLGSGDYPVWGVGLQFSYPLGNRTAENDYIKTKLRIEQNRMLIKSQQETVANEVRAAVRAIDVNYKQLEVTKRGRAYAEERLNAFIKRSQVGLATMRDVLDVENDLVTAKGEEVKALAAYNSSIYQLWRVTGDLLSRQGVKVSVDEADTLYERSK
ncbi:TolC family protein [Geobacter sp. DSM 9736]|uniref:TolC family protein n=1 Tax=Geobacter sp. DSM 9736 TaxID=1277350 RepID=UPI001E283E26|nr:TolC family protein [Geobacter sp. DSM 9736]